MQSRNRVTQVGNKCMDIKGERRSGRNWGIGVNTCTLLCIRSLSRTWLFAAAWTVAHQAPSSMVFPKQEYWSELPFPSQRTFQTQGLNPCLLHWLADSLPLSHQGSSSSCHTLPLIRSRVCLQLDPKSILKHPLPSSLSSLLFPAFVSLLMQKTVNFFYCYYLKIWKECN